MEWEPGCEYVRDDARGPVLRDSAPAAAVRSPHPRTAFRRALAEAAGVPEQVLDAPPRRKERLSRREMQQLRHEDSGAVAELSRWLQGDDWTRALGRADICK